MQAIHRVVSTRLGTLIAAVGAALAAGAILLVYLNRYREEVKAEGRPVTVLVASQSIPIGTSGSVIASKGLYTATTIREGQLREGAISDPASLSGKVTVHEIFEGAQLTASSFAAAGDSLAATITDRQRVVSVPLDSAHGLIGSLEPGNRVDVYAGFNVIPLKRDGTPVAAGQTRPMLRLIVPDVPVVKIGEKKRGSNRGADVSLRVTDVQAAKIAFASDNGKVWLALRPGAGAKSSKPGIVTVETLLLGVPPIQVIRSLRGQA
jgi:Flp pilus assembly protein CpaB